RSEHPSHEVSSSVEQHAPVRHVVVAPVVLEQQVPHPVDLDRVGGVPILVPADVKMHGLSFLVFTKKLEEVMIGGRATECQPIVLIAACRILVKITLIILRKLSAA